MLKIIFRWIFKKNGWRVDNPVIDQCQRCVMIGAPHTSNWDFVYCLVAFEIMQIPLRFTIKKEWVKGPVGWFVNPLGAIGIDRNPKGLSTEKLSMVDAMVNLIHENERIAVLVTPEGTRKAVKKWKTGFYRVAVKANVPIALGYLDYERKVAGVAKVVWPTGDYKKDMEEIIAFYRTVKPKFRELNSINRPDFVIE